MKDVTIQVVSASVPVRFFTTATVLANGSVHPHASNTGDILIGATSGSEGIVLNTGDSGYPLAPWVDAYTLYVNSTNVSNQAVLLYDGID